MTVTSVHAKLDELQSSVDKLLDRLLVYIRYIDEGHAIVNAGVELMTAEQLSEWSGVRGWLEADPRDPSHSPLFESTNEVAS